MTTLSLKAHKLYPDVKLPVFSTKGSACFDIHAYYTPEIGCRFWNDNRKDFIERHDKNITIHPFQRVLVPTGIILDIPPGHSVRIHPRSGTAIKQGMSFINCEGVIDSDYVEPVYMMIYNISGYQQFITNGERICQAELIKEYPCIIMETEERPERKTDRDGGFGSTGN